MSQEIQQLILPSNPADRKAIMDAMEQISASYTRIEGERDYIKEAINELAEKFGLPKAALRRLSRIIHKGNFEEEAAKFEEVEELYTTLVESTR